MRKLLNGIAGFVIPIRITSRLYLIERLTHYGIDVKRIPEGCLQELADQAVTAVKSIAAVSHRGWREIITLHLDGLAVNLANMLDGRPSNHLPSEYVDHIRRILDKHAVSLPLKP